MSSTKVIGAGVDIGGSRIKLVGVTPDGSILDKNLIDTADDAPSTATKTGYWVRAIREYVHKLEASASAEVRSIGLAAPGIPAPDGASIASMPGRLAGLEGLDWRSELGLERPVAVLNDSHAALVGEAWLGSAAGARDVVLLTLGTGVGGAAMVNGALLRGSTGRAAHFGHISLDLDGPADICGTPGSLEWFVGDATVEERSSGRYASNRDLLAALAAGDDVARGLWLRSMRALACGITSIVNLFDPELVLLAGGLTEAWDAIIEPLEGFMDELEWRPRGRGVPIRRAALGSFAGAVGAARCAAGNTALGEE